MLLTLEKTYKKQSITTNHSPLAILYQSLVLIITLYQYSNHYLSLFIPDLPFTKIHHEANQH